MSENELKKKPKVTWLDQPAELEDAKVMGQFSVETHHRESHSVTAEIRIKEYADDDWFYLTVGTLFGSQTIRCRDAALVLEVLCNFGRKGFKLPDGVTVLNNTERKAD